MDGCCCSGDAALCLLFKMEDRKGEGSNQVASNSNKQARTLNFTPVPEGQRAFWRNYAPWEQTHGGDQSAWLGIKGPAVNTPSSSERCLSNSPVVQLFLDGPRGPRAMLRKTDLVHIAARLRHGELYGKKAWGLPSESALGSVRLRVQVDILKSPTGMVQLSETIHHRESKPTAHYRSLQSKRQAHFCLLCRLPIHNLKEKATVWFALHFWMLNIFLPSGWAKGRYKSTQRASHVQKKKA